MNRVVYYSPGDWSGGYNLEKAEEIIKAYDENKEYDINELLEFYNIYKFFQNKVYLKNWSKEQISDYSKIVNKMKGKVFKYFKLNVNSSNLSQMYEEVDLHYKNNFFELLSKCINMNSLLDDDIEKLLRNKSIRIIDILEYKELITRFDILLTKYFQDNIIESVELIIKKYYIDEEKYDKLYMPKSLTLGIKESLILKYIESPYANLNFIRIIAKIQSNKDYIVISDKTKLKASKKRIELEKKLFENSNIKIKYGYGVAIADNQEEDIIVKNENNDVNYSYSGKWIRNNLDYPTLLNNFIYLFEYVDTYFRINLVNMKKDSGLFERMNLKVLKSYSPNQTFKTKAAISNMQIAAYYNYLYKQGIRLEDIIEWFFGEYLKQEFNVNNFIISMPSKESNYFEKCKSILPEFDLILKEFKFYCEDGEIDQELVNISSTQMFFKDIPSLNKKKYVYAFDNDDTLMIMHYFFSDQSMLNYDPKNNKSYICFFELLRNKKMKYSDYEEYQQRDLDWLISHDLIYLENDYIKIKNVAMISIYGDLYINEVINYWRYPKELRIVVDEMIKDNILYVESSLFSKLEQDYFNYYLNMSEFIDGFDIRNSNLHGSQVGDRKSNVHLNRYMIILQLLVLIVIKINDDFCIYDENEKTGD